MNAFRRDPAGRPTLGVEIELGILRPGRPVGDHSQLPHKLLAAAVRNLPTLPRARRSGVFTCAGLMYVEMSRLLELATWPAADLPAVLRQEDAALEMARAVHAAAECDPRFRMVCIADDLGGMPLPLRRGAAPSRTLQERLADRGGRSARGRRVSSSMGTHINLLVPAGAERVRELAVVLGAALPEVVGPGGFVRRTRGMEFWRDPRGAHVTVGAAPSSHDLTRPMLKQVGDSCRLQIVGLGHAQGRLDRQIKYGLLLLLGCHAAAGTRTPRFRVARPGHLLWAPPGRTIAFRRAGRTRRSTRLELLEMLLDDVLEPAARTDLGQGARCEEAIAGARAAIDALRGNRDAAGIGTRLPLAWAIKQHVFARLLAAHGLRLPTRRWAEPPEVPDACAAEVEQELARLAVLSLAEGDVVHDDVREFLLGEVDGRPWSHECVYGRDPDACAAVREGRMPAGALGPAAEICANLGAPGRERNPLFADWHGLTRAPVPEPWEVPPEPAAQAPVQEPAQAQAPAPAPAETTASLIRRILEGTRSRMAARQAQRQRRPRAGGAPDAGAGT